MSAHQHDHDPGHRTAPSGSLTALAVTFALTATIFLAQVIGGLVSGSLALLSDAMHMLSDSTGLLIALVALLIGRRAATPRATYGSAASRCSPHWSMPRWSPRSRSGSSSARLAGSAATNRSTRA